MSGGAPAGVQGRGEGGGEAGPEGGLRERQHPPVQAHTQEGASKGKFRLLLNTKPD